jgi:hypothetical protein
MNFPKLTRYLLCGLLAAAFAGPALAADAPEDTPLPGDYQAVPEGKSAPVHHHAASGTHKRSQASTSKQPKHARKHVKAATRKPKLRKHAHAAKPHAAAKHGKVGKKHHAVKKAAANKAPAKKTHAKKTRLKKAHSKKAHAVKKAQLKHKHGKRRHHKRKH